MDAMLEAIAISSPSGHISKRALREAQERIRQSLFGDGLAWPRYPEPPKSVTLRRQATELRGLAERGMKTRAYLKRAIALEAEANALDAIA